MRPDWRLPGAVLLLTLLGAAMLLGRVPVGLAIGYAMMCGLSFFAYRADKIFAEAGHWRISEMTLHTLDLGLGVGGGLLAQALFRHKTRKPGYGAVTLLILAGHLLWLAGLATGLTDATDLIALWPPALAGLG